MSQLKAIVFDMDGLMVDSEPLSQQAWNVYLRPYGHHLNEEIVSQIIGLRADLSTPYIKDLFNLPEDVTTIISKSAAIYSQIRANGVPVMPGLMELHAEIGRRQIPWAVATSSPRAHAEEILHDNDGRKVHAYLPQQNFEGVPNAVVQVIVEATGEILYTVRTQGPSFKPRVYAPGKYTIKMGSEKPDTVIAKGLEV